MSAVVSFGKYELVSRLARGGMAETYRAQLRGAAGVTKQVVIKKVLPEYGEDKDFIEAFINEAKVSASLSHGNIAQVFDFGEVDGDYFIAMELVDGRSLVEVLFRAAERGFPTLPVPIACFITIETLKGLHYAHTRLGDDGRPLNIVHRDISPENVLVAFSGNTKVVDFGVAKAALHGRKETEPGKVKGKFQYLSPEQARGEPLDGRSDVFAVGIILYRMLCGVLPFEGQMHLVMRAIADGKFVPPATVNPALPPTLVAVIEKAMAARREDRYASALQMHEALSRILYRDEPTFSEEAVKEWMTWLFRPELQGEGRAVSVSKKFEAQLARWDPHGPKHVTSQAIRKVKPGRRSRAPLWFAGAALLLAATVGVAALLTKGAVTAAPPPLPDSGNRVFPAPIHVSPVKHGLRLKAGLPEFLLEAPQPGPLYEGQPTAGDAPLFAITGDGHVAVVLKTHAPGLPPFSSVRLFDFQPFDDQGPEVDHNRMVIVYTSGRSVDARSTKLGPGSGGWATVTGVHGRARLTLTPDHPDAWAARPRPPSVVVAWRRRGPPSMLQLWPNGVNRSVLTAGRPIEVQGAAEFAFAFVDPEATGEADAVTVTFEPLPEEEEHTGTYLVPQPGVEPLFGVDAGALPEGPADLTLALTRLKAGDFAGAKDAAERCLAEHPDHPDCHLAAGDALKRLKAGEQAVRHYRAAAAHAEEDSTTSFRARAQIQEWETRKR